MPVRVTSSRTPAVANPPPRSTEPTDKRAQSSTAKASGDGDHFDAASAGRRDPAEALKFLAAFDRTLGLSATDAATKRANMRAGTLEFYRATPALFVRDLQGPFASMARLSNAAAPKIPVLVDSHIGNFGTFRGPDGHAVWGVNDYDQAGTGSPEIDLERLAASVVLAGRNAGLSEKDQRGLVRSLFEQYADSAHAVAKGKEPAQAWLSAEESRGAVSDLLHDAEGTKRKDFLGKYVKDLDKKPRFKSNDELLPVSSSEASSVKAALAAYAKALPSGVRVKQPLNILDVSRRLGGGSSYGLPRYVALVESTDGKAPTILELKAAPPSPLVDSSGAAAFDAAAVVRNQTQLAGRANPLTGTAVVGRQSLLVRELEPEKSSAKLDKLSPKKLEKLVSDAARVLARAHGAQPSNAKALAQWLDASPDAERRLEAFALAYADQTERDFAAFPAGLG